MPASYYEKISGQIVGEASPGVLIAQRSVIAAGWGSMKPANGRTSEIVWDGSVLRAGRV